MLVGAGGAGRAVAFGARSRGARLVIFDIDFGIETMYIIICNEPRMLFLYMLTFFLIFVPGLKLPSGRGMSSSLGCQTFCGGISPLRSLCNGLKLLFSIMRMVA